MSGELSQSVLRHISDTLEVDNSGQPTTCILCRRILSADHEGSDIEAFNICGDCKFLFLEDLGTPTREEYLRRHGLRRRRRYTSSESIENLFSQQFSHMIELARNNQAILPEHDTQSLNSDAATRLSQQVSLHTTPSGSRRWRRVLSDTDSDGFGSLYGESESNISFSGYRHFHGDSDTLSYSAYGGDSDASVDAHSFLENETFLNPDGGSDFDTDTDIDPMNAGLYQWYSDDQEEAEDEDNEWEEGDDEESRMDSWRVRARIQRSISPNERRAVVNWRRQTTSREFEGMIHPGTHEMRRARNSNISANLEEAEAHNYAGNYEDFLNARGFEELLERLGENDNSRRGAPPAAASFVKNLPHIIITKDHENLDELACAICKDSISVGTVVNQLPCFHLYHPSCITPWLSARNSCPLCRFELPTDDKDYENRKQMGNSGLDLHEIQQQELNGDSFSDLSDDAEAEEHGELGNGRIALVELRNMNGVAEDSSRLRGRSFFHVTAGPIVSIVGIVLVLWLGNSLTTRRLPSGPQERRQHLNSYIGSCPSNQRVDSGRRRWWSLF